MAWGHVRFHLDVFSCQFAKEILRYPLNTGSSKGSSDWACELEEKIGQMICYQTNHGPGHHSLYALVSGTPIVGISGPSTGAALTLGFYLKALMRAASSLDPSPVLTRATLVKELPAPRRGGHGKTKAEKERPPAKVDRLRQWGLTIPSLA